MHPYPYQLRPIVRAVLFALLFVLPPRWIRSLRCELFRRKAYLCTRGGNAWWCAICWCAIYVSGDVMRAKGMVVGL